MRERERERERDRQTDGQTDRQTETETERDRQTETETYRERHRETQRETETETDRQTERKRHTHTHTHTQRDRQRDRDSDRDRDRERTIRSEREINCAYKCNVISLRFQMLAKHPKTGPNRFACETQVDEMRSHSAFIKHIKPRTKAAGQASILALRTERETCQSATPNTRNHAPNLASTWLAPREATVRVRRCLIGSFMRLAFSLHLVRFGLV